MITVVISGPEYFLHNQRGASREAAIAARGFVPPPHAVPGHCYLSLPANYLPGMALEGVQSAYSQSLGNWSNLQPQQSFCGNLIVENRI